MSYEIKILDTGDNYIISQKNYGYQYAFKLYEMMDISINEISTDVFVPPDIADFVYKSIGRVIAYGFVESNNNDNKTELPKKLLTDINTTIEFSKIRSFWENMQYPPKPKDKYDETMLYDTKGIINQEPLTIDKLLPKESLTEDGSNKTINVLFNTIYNIALVVDYPTSVVDNIVKYFPEFQLATLSGTSTKIDYVKDNFVRIFHKISFSNIDEVKNKIDAFKKLYDITVIGDDLKKGNISYREKMRIKQFLEWNFVLSKDIEKRVRANDLYKEVINHMCIPYEEAASFKKRFAGYLLEFNLQKKRYSDAYYYYGIEKKEPVKMSLEEIEERRAKERKEWFYYPTNLIEKQSTATEQCDELLKKLEIQRNITHHDLRPLPNITEN